MDLYSALTDDEILIESKRLDSPIVVRISRPNVVDSMRLSDLARKVRDSDEAGRESCLEAMCDAVRLCIRDVREQDGSSVFFRGLTWPELDGPGQRDALVAFYGILVSPLLAELVGAVLGTDTTGKSLRRSEAAS